MKNSSVKQSFLLIPSIGICTFALLYFVATRYYPGGSQADKTAVGFSWMHNYWCNLLNEKAINGELNPARPTALFAMSVLCISLSVFWLVIPRLFDFQPILKIILKISGVSAMVLALFIFTAWHDVITYLSSALGVVALTMVTYGLYKSRFKKIFWWGIANLVLVGVNNFLYNSPELIYWLPLVQKVTFLCFLSWVIAMNFALFKHSSF